MVIAVNEGFERRLGIIPAGFDNDDVFYANTLLSDFPLKIPNKKVDQLSETATGWMLLNYGNKITVSSALTGYEPYLAADENARTWWCAKSASRDEWLMVDLENECRINALQVNFAEHEAKFHGRGKEQILQYVIETSPDGKTWAMLVDKSKNKKDVPHDYIPLDNPVKARFVRLSGVKMAHDGPVAVRDLRIFGKGNGKAPQPVNGLVINRDEVKRLSASLKWDKNEHVMGYVLRYGISPDKFYHNYQVMGTNELIINSLNRDASYFFTIDAFNENGYTKGIITKKVE